MVWISPKAGAPHDVRVKVSKAHRECVVRVKERGPKVHPSELISALQEQLGLKWQPAKGRVKVLVVDSIERPSEN